MRSASPIRPPVPGLVPGLVVDRTAGRPARSGVRLPALLLAATLGAVAFAGAATAREHVRPERLTVYADVLDVRPVYEEVSYFGPTRECWTEEVRHVVREDYARPHRAYRDGHPRERRGGEAIVGGLIGGVVGNQLGRNSSRGTRAGATIAGAIIGSAVANETSAANARHRRHAPRYHAPRTVYETRPVERCREVESSRAERRLQHYDVTYRYDGRTYTTRLPRDPGAELELNVTLTPARF